ncbi:MAG: hypothetical protein PHV06_02045 [bacterium]|nr:hypothetical protein [bacterium]
MEEKKKFKIILRVVLILIFFYYLFTFAGLVKDWLVKEYVDFPCQAEVSGDCLEYSPESGEILQKNVKMEVFITVFTAGVRGGGCEHMATSGDKIKILNHDLSTDGDVLVVDNKVKVFKGNTWEKKKVILKSYLNPWRIKKNNFMIKNHGIISCRRDLKTGTNYSYGPTLVATGNAGTYYKPNWNGIIFLVVFIIIFILTFKKKKVAPEKVE